MRKLLFLQVLEALRRRQRHGAADRGGQLGVEVEVLDHGIEKARACMILY